MNKVELEKELRRHDKEAFCKENGIKFTYDSFGVFIAWAEDGIVELGKGKRYYGEK